tara:strand:- start:527 stop:706 length:180 start_codon:yes stop_codon:yes gene_type:complete
MPRHWAKMPPHTEYRIHEYNSFMRANEDTKKREYRSMKDYEILFLAAAIILQIQLMMKR